MGMHADHQCNIQIGKKLTTNALLPVEIWVEHFAIKQSLVVAAPGWE